MHKLYGVSRRLYDDSGNEIIFSRGDGGFVYSTHSVKYIDMLLGYGPIILGHGNKEFACILEKKICQGQLFPTYSTSQIELAESIEKYYKNYQLLSVYQSGSDAMDAILRISRYISSKEKFIRYGYIGWHDQLLFNGVNWHEPINSIKSKNTAICVPGTHDNIALNWFGEDIDSFKKILQSGDIGCFVFDAYQLERKTKVDIKEIINLCRKYNVIVVLDETKTSGRVTKYGYYVDKLDFDFTIFGKAIGNGYPVSLLVASKRFMHVPYDEIKIAGTYARDGLCCEAVLATSEIMEQNGFYNKISETGNKIAESMNNSIHEIMKNNDVNVHVMLQGGILEFTYSEAMANNFQQRKRFSDILLKNGIIISDGHCFYICVAHEKCLDELNERFRKALRDYISSETMQ